jgi:cysteine desulfurase
MTRTPTLPIYLDYNATTPPAPAVIDAMLPWLRGGFGNPSSAHSYGRDAHDAVARARHEVAQFIGAHDDEIIFTGGGSEATNHALKGAAFAQLQSKQQRGLQIAYSAIEHPATIATAQALRHFGFAAHAVAVDRCGIVDLGALATVLRAPTLVLSVMHANNETGVIQPISAIASAARAAGALMHVDASQSAGKLPVDVTELGADLLTLAGHKLYAPKGVGALYVRRGIHLEPLIHGAGHESGRRAGTENVPYLVALGVACRLASSDLEAESVRQRALRDRLWHRILDRLGEQVVMNGWPAERLPNTLNVSFIGLSGAELLAAIPDIAASTGSACHDGRVQFSPVLTAMNVDARVAAGAIRLSLGRQTTEDEIDRAAHLLATRALELQATSPARIPS